MAIDITALIGYLLAALVGGGSSYVVLRLLPSNMANLKANTLLTLSDTVDKLIMDLTNAREKHDAEMALARAEIKNQANQIAELQRPKKAVLLKAEFHIVLEDEPQLENHTLEYITQLKPEISE
jgi:hypothetical protein